MVAGGAMLGRNPFVVLVCLVVVALGCAPSPASHGRPDDAPPPPETTSPNPPPASSDDGYAAMCSHYCDTLDATLTYACLAEHRSDTCPADGARTTAQCEELRCTPKLVTVELCLRQCDSLRAPYAAICANPAPGAPCPSSPGERDRQCRAGCTP
jgi:hypothetical protein